jgi:hypothetical protein
MAESTGTLESHTVAERRRSRLTIASLVLGIVGIGAWLAFFLPTYLVTSNISALDYVVGFFNFALLCIGPPSAILAIVFGAVALRRTRRDSLLGGMGQAITGLVPGITALSVSVLMLVIFIIFVLTFQGIP